MSSRITKHFVTVGNRRVHYHRAGSGPAVALLHASPCSAKVLRLPLETFASRFTGIAFDTPGFGLSDPLPLQQPETEDLADGLAETLAALGVEHAAVYGRHTGAQIAVEFAARHSANCAMVLTDGFPIFSREVQSARLERYLPPLIPTFDGAHLLWLWFRYREQHVFWPWNEQRAANRSDADVPDPTFLHRGVMELLEAGDAYRVGYATAFRHRGLGALPNLKVPACFGARTGDSQFKTLRQFPPGTWTMEMPREPRDAAQAELKVLQKHPANGSAPNAPKCTALPGRTTTEYVDFGDGQILVRSCGNLEASAPIVLIHHAPGSSALYDGLICAIGKHRPAIAFDLPGQGESDTFGNAQQTVEAWADALFRLLDALNVAAVHLYGHGGGAAVAVEAARRRPARVRSLVLDSPICFTESQRTDLAERWLEGVAPIAPTWNGEHLIRVWHMRRDMELWWPWYERRFVNARTTEPRIDPARLTLEVREMMKQPEHFVPAWRAVLNYPLMHHLGNMTTPTSLIAAPQDLFAECLPQARAALRSACTFEIEDTDESRAHAIRKAVTAAD